MEEEPLNLRKELKSPDLEVRRRVVQILEAYVPKQAKRGLARVKDLAREGRVDEMAECLVLWKKWDKTQEWRALVDLCSRLALESERTYGKTEFELSIKRIQANTPPRAVPPKNLADHWQASLKLVREDNVALVDKLDWEPRRMIIAPGNVHSNVSRQGIVVAGGNVQISSVDSSVLICDGDCEVFGGINDSLIIVRGKLTCPRQINKSVILSESCLVVPNRLMVWDCAIINGGKNRLVHFFDPREVGLEAWEDVDKTGKVVPNGGARIYKIREGTPFASRLRVADVVTAINGTETPSFEIFRRVLRRKLAEARPFITFTVRREEKALDVSVPIKD